jgi:hypothetical protein
MIQIIDNFFPDEVCTKLRNFMLEKNSYDELYADYAAVNFYDRTDEIDYIQNKIVELKKFSYLRSWSFIYRNFARGVLPHADPARYTLSIWVSLDESILDRRENGLNVYTVKPISENSEKYSNGYEYVYDVIKDVDPVRIPYKYNRAILFDSLYIHSSGNVSMKPGDGHRRIGYTYLFG